MPEKYKTKSGDTWDKIAREVYGNESYISLLMSENQELLSYFVFPEGIEILISNKKTSNNMLPDWRV